MKQKAARLFHFLAVTAGAGALGSILHVLPQVVPAEYAAASVLILQAVQAALGDHAYSRNWDGSPAELPAPPKPQMPNP